MTARQFRKEQRRRAFLDAASESFLQRGYGNTTMSSIAAAVGGSKGTLWAHFPTKRALFVAVMDDWADKLQESCIPNSDGNLRTELEEYCTSFIAMLLSPTAIALYRLIIAEVPRFPELGRIFFERGRARQEGMLADYLRIQIERQAMEHLDPLSAAIQLHNLCRAGPFNQALLGGNEVFADHDIREQARAVVSLFLDGYGTRRSRQCIGR